MADLDLDDWPNCPTPDCPNKVCLWAGTGVCHRCSQYHLGVEEMENRYAATRDDEGYWSGEQYDRR